MKELRRRFTDFISSIRPNFNRFLSQAMHFPIRRRGSRKPTHKPQAVREVEYAAHLLVNGEPIEGTLTITGSGRDETWTLRWPGGEILFKPPESLYTPTGYLGDELLGHFITAELKPRGIILCVCGVCTGFRFSGMSWDMSGGWVGYCLRRAKGAPAPLKDTVGILDWCPAWEPRIPLGTPGAERVNPADSPPA